MNILFFAHAFSPHLGGVGKCCRIFLSWKNQLC